MSRNYVCSVCGAGAYYDGRMGDGPVLVCGCDRIGSRYVKDRIGGYHTNPTGARPVDGRWETPKKRTVIKNGRTTVVIVEEEDYSDWCPR